MSTPTRRPRRQNVGNQPPTTVSTVDSESSDSNVDSESEEVEVVPTRRSQRIQNRNPPASPPSPVASTGRRTRRTPPVETSISSESSASSEEEEPTTPFRRSSRIQSQRVQGTPARRTRRTTTSPASAPVINLYNLIMTDKYAAIDVIHSGNFTADGLERDIAHIVPRTVPKNMTYLMLACLLDKPDIALELIKSGKSLPSTVNELGLTALLMAIQKNMKMVVIKLIETGESYPDYIAFNNINGGTTALLESVSLGDNKIVNKLLQTGKSLVNYIDYFGNSALSLAIMNGEEKIALSIIKYDSSTVNMVDADGETPLILALRYGKKAIVDEIVRVGLVNTEYVAKNGYTALLYACIHNMEDVALEIVKTKKCNPFIHIIPSLETAKDIAVKNKMSKVVKAIEDLGTSELEIDINETAFNTITQETSQIKSYLAKDMKNICFKYNNHYFLSNVEEIKHQLLSPQHIKYKCIRVGHGDEFVDDSNLVTGITYFGMSSISGFQVVVPMKEITVLVYNSKSSNMFCLSYSGKMAGAMSEAYYKNISTIGGDHCTPDKPFEICHIIKGIPVCGNVKSPGSHKKQTTPTSTNHIILQYGEKREELNYIPTEKIGEMKHRILKKMGEENKKVSFIYSGRVYRDDKDADLVSSIVGLEPGKTILVRFSALGGRKTRRRRIT